MAGRAPSPQRESHVEMDAAAGRPRARRSGASVVRQLKGHPQREGANASRRRPCADRGEGRECKAIPSPPASRRPQVQSSPGAAHGEVEGLRVPRRQAGVLAVRVQRWVGMRAVVEPMQAACAAQRHPSSGARQGCVVH